MSYLPLARKYRPKTFADLIGQPHVTATLTQAITSGHLAQAYLFTGQRGVGKTSAARILAACLNCAKGPTPTPCGACPSCMQMVQGNSLDVIEIDGASNRGIEEIRALRETVPFAPTTGHFRIYIIDEVHMLTTEAFNALLKTLEEPPAHVKFIFATTSAQKVPATILSRCQRFDFRRVDAPTIVGALAKIAKAEKIPIDEPALYAIARAADGSLRDAEVVLDQARSFSQGKITEADITALLGAVDTDVVERWAQAILDRQAPEALGLLAEQLERGKDAPQLLAGLLRHLRNLLIIRTTQQAKSGAEVLAHLLDEPAERIERLTTQAAAHAPEELVVLLQMLIGAYELVRRSPMAQTVLELTIIKLALREQWQSLDAISRRLEHTTSEPSSPAPSRPAVTAPPQPARAKAAAPTQTSSRAAEPVVSQERHIQARVATLSVEEPAADPAPEAAAPAASEALQAPWTRFLEQLGAQKMSLAAYLAEALPMELTNGRLMIGLPGFALHQEVLSVAEHRRLIERLASQAYQTAVTVEYTTLPESVKPAAPAAPSAAPSDASLPPAVQDIVQLFNATVLPPRTT